MEQLERDHRRIRRDLNRFQEDAEVKWIQMRDGVRVLLDAMEEAFIESKEQDANEGLRDIDNSRPVLRDFREPATLAAEHPRGASRRSVSEHRRKGLLSKEQTRELGGKNKMQRELSAKVQRLESELDERRNYEQHVLQQYQKAKKGAEEAQYQFQLTEYRHEQEEQRFAAGRAAGEEMGSPTEFDLKLLLDKKRLTRNLVEAEEDLKLAKTKAIEEGVYLDDGERSSGFLDRESDGYAESRAGQPAGVLDPGEFMQWLGGITEDCGSRDGDSTPDVDEWDARSVEMWDSVSLVAKGSDRTRIDRWRLRGRR